MYPLRALLKARNIVVFDAISWFLIIAAFFFFAVQMFLFLPNVGDSVEVTLMMWRNGLCFSLLTGSLVVMMMNRTYIPSQPRFYDEYLSSDDLSLQTALTIIGLLMITIINYITFSYTSLNAVFAVTPDPLFSKVTFSFFVGITEEVTFRGLLLTYASNISWSPLAIVLSTICWWIFHGGVYGLSAGPMIIIIASGFVISGLYVVSGNRLAVPMLPHGINNIGAYMLQNVAGNSQAAVTTMLRLIQCLG